MTGIQALAAPLRRPATTTLVASAAALGSIACSVAAVLINAGPEAGPQPADLTVATAFPLVAALILAHQPRNAVGWMLLACAWMGPYLLAGQYAVLTVDDPTVLKAPTAWLSMWGFVVSRGC
jgi:hypothetical protein